MEEDVRAETERQVLRLKGARPQLWSLTQAGVAVAVAVIKNRPAGMSGGEFAEALASGLRSQDEGWREKSRRLQQEVLRLRQELLVTRLSGAHGGEETAGHDSTVDNMSQDLFGPSDSETPELLEQDIQPVTCVPQPPAPCSYHRGPDGDALEPHVNFLQALCALHRVEETHRGLEALWFGPDGGAGSVLADSVCHLLDSVVAACRDPPPPGRGGDPVLHACQVAARATELFCRRKPAPAALARGVEESLRELTGMLLGRRQPSGLAAAEKLTQYLVTLGSSSMSRSFLIRHLLSQISGVADQLWQLVQGQESAVLDTFPLDQYQNSCSLFWILEELLRRSSVACRAELRSEASGFLRRLEQRVFLLSDEFPLFSIYMWRIGGLLSSCDT